MLKGSGLSAAVASASLMVAAAHGPALAQSATWKYSSWTPPASVNNKDGTIPMFAEIDKRTNKSFAIQNFMGAQLFNNRTTLKGVTDGVVDAGVVVPAFTPQELKHAVVITDAVAMFTDEWISVPAANEALFTTCKECMADFKANGTISLGAYGGGNLRMQCAVPVNSADDLKGLKAAGVSSMTARWAAMLGQTRQQIGPGEILAAMQRRQVDCSMSALEHLLTLSLKDVVKTIVDHPLGAFPAIHLMVINQKSWQNLPMEFKKLVLEETPKAIARSTAAYATGEDQALAVAKERNIKVVKFPAYDKLWAEFVETERSRTIAELGKARGLPEETTNKVLKAHLDLMPKWKAIMDRAGRNQQALAKAMWDEIYSKLDPDRI
jgi:TRAP-type transport system periplasmic protein